MNKIKQFAFELCSFFGWNFDFNFIFTCRVKTDAPYQCTFALIFIKEGQLWMQLIGE